MMIPSLCQYVEQGQYPSAETPFSDSVPQSLYEFGTNTRALHRSPFRQKCTVPALGLMKWERIALRTAQERTSSRMQGLFLRCADNLVSGEYIFVQQNK